VPTWSDLLTVEELVQSGQVTDSMTRASYGIGGAGYLTRKFAGAAAQQLCRALTSSISPHTPVYLGVMGYDDDPRELHEIPEVRQYLGWFATEFDQAGIDETRLIQQSRELVSLGARMPQEWRWSLSMLVAASWIGWCRTCRSSRTQQRRSCPD
jgi:hypothetical protein